MSHIRLCRECGRENASSAYDQMQAHDGPVFEWWRIRIAASVGAVPLDYLTERP